MNLNLSLNIRTILKARCFVAIAPIIAAMAMLPLAAPVFAQSSLDSSAAPPTDYAVPPPGGSLVEPSLPGGAVTDDSAPDDSTPDDTSASDASTTDLAPGPRPRPRCPGRRCYGICPRRCRFWRCVNHARR